MLLLLQDRMLLHVHVHVRDGDRFSVIDRRLSEYLLLLLLRLNLSNGRRRMNRRLLNDLRRTSGILIRQTNGRLLQYLSDRNRLRLYRLLHVNRRNSARFTRRRLLFFRLRLLFRDRERRRYRR